MSKGGNVPSQRSGESDPKKDDPCNVSGPLVILWGIQPRAENEEQRQLAEL